jgi:hypothetical protein
MIEQVLVKAYCSACVHCGSSAYTLCNTVCTKLVYTANCASYKRVEQLPASVPVHTVKNMIACVHAGDKLNSVRLLDVLQQQQCLSAANCAIAAGVCLHESAVGCVS